MIIDIIKSYNGICIIDKNGPHSFEDLINEIEKIRLELDGKINKNEKIVIYSDYNFYSISLLLLLSEYPINIIPIVKTTEKEFEDKISSVNPEKILSFDESGSLILNSLDSLSEIPKGYSDISSTGDTGIVLFSSGTTGKPKVMIQNLTELIKAIKKPRKQKSLIFIIFLMFDHIGGLNTLLNCLISGSPFVIPKDRNPSTIINLIEKHKVNILPTSPTFLNLMLLDDNFDPKKLLSLKLITYGTERMSEVLLKKTNSFLPNIKLLQTFGTSETGILKTISKSSNSLFFKIVDEEKEHRIVDGELYLRSKTSVKGYLNHSNDNFKSDGWYATGDLVEIDDEGFIKIIGRKNNVINVGGLKVLPSEIEGVINSIEGVVDSTVYGQENNITGNIVCAKVYTDLKETKSLKSLIKKTCRERLDKFKVPVILIFDELKITQRGKKNEKFNSTNST
jgi:acyl-coenzyme A synthetase/AMP-(fatty) acid ligase